MLVSSKTGKRIRKTLSLLMQPHSLKALLASSQPRGVGVFAAEQVMASRGFLQLPPSLQSPSPLVFVAVWLPRLFQRHSINSTCSTRDQAFGKEKKYGIQELRLPHTKTIREGKTSGSLHFSVVSCFSTDLRSRASSSYQPNQTLGMRKRREHSTRNRGEGQRQ